MTIKILTRGCCRCEYTTNSGVKRILEEGHDVVLEKEEILKSTDVVLLVEARHCNKMLTQKKPLNRFDRFIHVVNDELASKGLRDVRSGNFHLLTLVILYVKVLLMDIMYSIFILLFINMICFHHFGKRFKDVKDS